MFEGGVGLHMCAFHHCQFLPEDPKQRFILEHAYFEGETL